MHPVIRNLALVAATGVVSASAYAQASCPSGSTAVTGTALQSLVSGATLCAASSTNADTWQEYHSGSSGGTLTDYKLGPGNPVDPTANVGTWALSSGVLTHTYSAGGSFGWLVCQVGSSKTYNLVSTGSSGTIYGANFLVGQVFCGTAGRGTVRATR